MTATTSPRPLQTYIHSYKSVSCKSNDITNTMYIHIEMKCLIYTYTDSTYKHAVTKSVYPTDILRSYPIPHSLSLSPPPPTPPSLRPSLPLLSLSVSLSLFLFLFLSLSLSKILTEVKELKELYNSVCFERDHQRQRVPKESLLERVECRGHLRFI